MRALCAFLFLACYYDYRYRRIPNFLLALMLLTGMSENARPPGSTVLEVLLGMGLVMLLLYPVFKLGALGAGDVKLLGICSGYFESDKILFFLFFSLLIAAIFSLTKLLREQNAMERLFYMSNYFLEVARSGKWRLYIENERERCRVGIPLAGPVLCSVLLSLGGVY